MKILIAPLNWGLGHASRCIPLIRQFLLEGHEVVMAGDGESASLLKRTFPDLRFITLPPLHLRYDAGTHQWKFMLRAIPQLIRAFIGDHSSLRQILNREQFSMVVSDNRFGFFSRSTHCVYITHQLYPILPRGFRWARPLAIALHAAIYYHYNECWVPDVEDSQHNLSGALSHRKHTNKRVKYIGFLSRFTPSTATNDKRWDVVAVLSGLEPQRTLFEQQIIQQYEHSNLRVLIVQGRISAAATTISHGSITLVNTLDDNQLVPILYGADKIIARSGYSTLMDLATLGLLHKAELYPTPGQSEQEYLWRHLNS